MKRTIMVVTAALAAVLCSAGSALAADSYTVCSAGPGKAFVAPKKSGKCGKRQRAMALASTSALSSLQGQVSALKGQVSSLQGQVSTLSGQVSDLQGRVSSLQSTFSGTSRNGNTLVFKGMNLQLESGSGATDGPINGLGNLIIGYNENPGTQTGSHNLVLGQRQSFTSYGGILGGDANTLSGPFSFVLGFGNTASGLESAVLGGQYNYAIGDFASVLGGRVNIASGQWSSVTGGYNNTASADDSSVTGGTSNHTFGNDSSVTGGYNNSANGNSSSVTGGSSNTASGQGSSVIGGANNTASGQYSTERGGSGQTVSTAYDYAP